MSSTDWTVKTCYLSVFRTGQNQSSVCLSHRTKPVISVRTGQNLLSVCLTHRTKPVICLSFAPDKTSHLSVFRSGQNQSSACLSFRAIPVIYLSFAPDKTSYLSVFRTGQNQSSVCLSHRTHSLSTSPHVVTKDCLFGLQFQPPPTATSNSHRCGPATHSDDPSQVGTIAVTSERWCLFLVLTYAMPVCFHNVLCLCRGVGMGSRGKQAGSMDEESQVRGCYNITFICTPTNQETVQALP